VRRKKIRRKGKRREKSMGRIGKRKKVDDMSLWQYEMLEMMVV